MFHIVVLLTVMATLLDAGSIHHRKAGHPVNIGVRHHTRLRHGFFYAPDPDPNDSSGGGFFFARRTRKHRTTRSANDGGFFWTPADPTDQDNKGSGILFKSQQRKQAIPGKGFFFYPEDHLMRQFHQKTKRAALREQESNSKDPHSYQDSGMQVELESRGKLGYFYRGGCETLQVTIERHVCCSQLRVHDKVEWWRLVEEGICVWRTWTNRGPDLTQHRIWSSTGPK